MQANRSNTPALIGGTILIAFGLLALAGQLFRSLNWSLLWPLMVMGLGGLFFLGMFLGGKSAAGLAIPGSILAGSGLVLLIQNLTHHRELTSYFWTLIILLVGVGIYVMGWYANDAAQKHSGWRVMRVGLILFLIFGIFFELLFSAYHSYLLPVLLIALGVYLVVTRSGVLAGRSRPSTEASTPVQHE